MSPTKRCSYCDEVLPRERFTRTTRTCDACFELKVRQAITRAQAARIPPSFPCKFGKAFDQTIPPQPPHHIVGRR